MALSFEPLGTTRARERARLLVVEDDLIAVFALRHFFAVAGYDVDCAAGPSEALRLLDQNHYQAVITDLHLLPGLHGEGLRVAAHARLRNPGACIVMITGAGTPGTEETARINGVDIYRTKPVELGEITACLNEVLGAEAPQSCESLERRRSSAEDGEA